MIVDAVDRDDNAVPTSGQKLNSRKIALTVVYFDWPRDATRKIATRGGWLLEGYKHSVVKSKKAWWYEEEEDRVRIRRRVERAILNASESAGKQALGCPLAKPRPRPVSDPAEQRGLSQTHLRDVA